MLCTRSLNQPYGLPASGETILWKHIASTTVQNYITDMDKLFKERKIVYRYDNDPLSIILKALSDYEQVPNRWQMITDEMMHFLRDQAKSASIDSLPRALFDWMVLGRYAGYRRSEWCQTTKTTYERLVDWPGKPAKAFIKEDFIFLTKTKRRLLGAVSRFRQQAQYVRITWRYQKNGDHGQDITFARDAKNPEFCPVEAALIIAARAARLRVPEEEPIAVYKAPDGRRKFITDGDATDPLRHAAHKVLGIPRGDPELDRWSSHSIRVTAANLLHRQKFSDSYIQNRLRWKKDAFKLYLRNTFYTADQHTLYISESNLPPTHERQICEDEPHERVLAKMATFMAS